MSSVKLSLVGAVASVLLVSAWCTWQRHERNAQAHELRLANAALQREVLVQHQVPVAPAHAADVPARESASAETPATPARETHTAAADDDYRFQGQATPVDTLQTMAWAMDRGDVERMMNIITFDEAARIKFAAYWASLPPASRTQWPTADALAATLLTNRGINRPYPRAHLLARATVESVGPDRVMVRLPGTPKDRELYQKIGDAWKWVITEALVDAYLEHVARQSQS